MIPHLFFHQLVVLRLVWLFFMLIHATQTEWEKPPSIIRMTQVHDQASEPLSIHSL
jgi:hypothetical protein